MNNCPRLLIILNRFVIGGQAADTISLAWHLKNKFDILILFGEEEKNEVQPLFLLQQYPGLKLIKVSNLRRSINPLTDVFAFFSILKITRKFNPHIVHTHGAKSGIIGRFSAWTSRVPVILHTFHGHLFHSYFPKPLSGLVVRIERLMSKITTAVIALSEGQKKELSEEFKIVPVSKIYIVPLGLNWKHKSESLKLRDAFRNRYAVQSSDIAIGIVGRIVAIKNHSFFVKVIERLLSENTGDSATFFIIGDGDLRKKIEGELKEKGIAFSNEKLSKNVRVVFTSWLTNIEEVMYGLDVVALTSLNEGTPLSIIEAQYYERPVVCTNVGGVKDAVINGRTGFISEKNDVSGFCYNLQLLIENENLRKSMGKEGKGFVSTKFSKEREVEVIKNLYFNLLRKKGYFI